MTQRMILFSCFVWLSDHWNISFHIHIFFQSTYSKQISKLALLPRFEKIPWQDSFPFPRTPLRWQSFLEVDYRQDKVVHLHTSSRQATFVGKKNTRKKMVPGKSGMKGFWFGGKNDVFLMARVLDRRPLELRKWRFGCNPLKVIFLKHLFNNLKRRFTKLRLWIIQQPWWNLGVFCHLSIQEWVPRLGFPNNQVLPQHIWFIFWEFNHYSPRSALKNLWKK